MAAEQSDQELVETLKAGDPAGYEALIDRYADKAYGMAARESLGSTGIGDGVAIPHGKVSDLHELVVAFGRSKKGIAFDAIDGKPVHLFFLLLAPENSTGQHLKALAKISKMLKTPNFRKKLIEAKTKSDLYKAIVEQDESCPV